MLLYGIIILVAMSLITTLNAFFNPMGYKWYHYAICTVIMTIAAIVVSGIIEGIIRAMPEKYFDCNKKFFTASKRELKFYQKIGVKKWKDHIPELGQFTGFHKNHVADPKNNEYISRFLLEASYGVAGHFWSIPIVFVIVFIDYGMWTGNNLWLTIGIPVSVVAAILNFMPIAVLKFNIPKLKAIYKLNSRTQTKKAAE